MVGYNILHQRQPLKKDHKFLTSFHDQISVIDYQKQNSDEKHCSFFDHALDDDDDEDEDINDDEGVTNEPQDVAERTIFWESQESLLQVYMFFINHFFSFNFFHFEKYMIGIKGTLISFFDS